LHDIFRDLWLVSLIATSHANRAQNDAYIALDQAVVKVETFPDDALDHFVASSSQKSAQELYYYLRPSVLVVPERPMSATGGAVRSRRSPLPMDTPHQ